MDEYSDSEEDRLRRVEFTARVLARLHAKPVAAPNPVVARSRPAAKPGPHLWELGASNSKELRGEIRQNLINRGVILPAPGAKRPYTLADARKDRWMQNAKRIGGP